MRFSFMTGFLPLAALAALSAPGECASVTSSFDSGAEGWTVDGDGRGLTWKETGGHAGGYLDASDGGSGSIWHFEAPEPFLGDRSRAYGQNLSFWLKQSATDSQIDEPDVLLTGAGVTLVYDTSANPGTDWTPYVVPLSETGGWRVGSLTGAAATQEQMRSVLADLTRLRIRGEYRSGADEGGLDDVEMALSAPVTPSLPVASTFDVDDEGWTVMGDVQHGSSKPTYEATGGNPGGCLKAVDNATGDQWHWVAPAKFLGDLSLAYGGALEYDIQASLTDASIWGPVVRITGARGVLTYTAGNPAPTWTPYRIPLTAAAGWMTADGSPASETYMRAVLSDVLLLRIRGEYHTGDDTGHLDNVRITTTPLQYGDANADGAVNALDAAALLRIAGGLEPSGALALNDVAPKPSAAPLGFGDGRLDVQDAMRVLRRVAGLETVWP